MKQSKRSQKRSKARDEEWKYVVLFHSTSEAIYAESAARDAGLSVKLRPIPRHLSSDCGICLAFNQEDREKLESLLHEKDVEYDRIASIL